MSTGPHSVASRSLDITRQSTTSQRTTSHETLWLETAIEALVRRFSSSSE
jgi:hypothetical protein